MITKLPLVVEKNVILVVYDRLLKIAYFIIMTKETSVKELAMLFRNHVWKFYGLLESVISNKGL